MRITQASHKAAAKAKVADLHAFNSSLRYCHSSSLSLAIYAFSLSTLPKCKLNKNVNAVKQRLR